MLSGASVLPPFSRSPLSHSIPSHASASSGSPKGDTVSLVHLYNCRVSSEDGISDLTSIWIDPRSGKIVGAQEAFYAAQDGGLEVVEVDLGGDLVAPGYIDTQINGAYSYDFSDLPPLGDEFPTVEAQDAEYLRRLESVSQRIVETGVTSFLPTVISQTSPMYHRLLPLLTSRSFEGGASVLGYHCEGPFLSPKKPGCHPQENLLQCPEGYKSFEEAYGKDCLVQKGVRMFTVAPEVPGVLDALDGVVRRGGVISVGHSNATNVEAMAAILAGATVVTHLYNAMPQLHHRDTGIIGLIGSPTYLPPSLSASLRRLVPDPISHLDSRQGSPVMSPIDSKKRHISADSLSRRVNQSLALSISASSLDDAAPSMPPSPPGSGLGGPFKRPFWGIIVDGIHVHPNAVRLAYQAFPEGCVLVTDCVHVMDPHAQDGLYPFRPPQQILRAGYRITLEGTDTLAGSAVDMTTCVLNLASFASIPLHKAIVCATVNAARSLGGDVAKVKGKIAKGWDADLVVLDEQGRPKATWVAGKKVWSRKDEMK